VPVIANGVEVLNALYREIIELANSYKPNPYNKSIHELFSRRLERIEGLAEVAEVENALRLGQMEELIEQAEDEIELCKELNETPEYQVLWEPSKEILEEWAGYSPPMGAGETLTVVTPKMFEALEDESCWEEIDKELDAEGVPKLPPYKLDKAAFKHYEKVVGYENEQLESGSQSTRIQDLDLKKRLDKRAVS